MVIFANHFKVIPQYCTVHPVLRMITRNWQQNIMVAFLAGKLALEKNGRFGKAWWEKKVEICGKEGKESWVKVLKSLKVQKHPSFLSRMWRNILKQGETSTGAIVLSS